MIDVILDRSKLRGEAAATSALPTSFVVGMCESLSDLLSILGQ